MSKNFSKQCQNFFKMSKKFFKKPKKFLVKVNGKTVAGSDTRQGATELSKRMKKGLMQEDPKKKFKIQVISHEDDLMEQAMRMGAGN